VGLIANPVASKDIRRLVGLARVVDVEEKANLIARFLVGLTAGPPARVLAFDDAAGLVRRAVDLGRDGIPPVALVDVAASGDESDSRRAAASMRDAGAAVLVTVGGDGTIRAAIEGWPDACLVPISAGTNNAVAIPDEPTAVGKAAAFAASEMLPSTAFQSLTALRVILEAGVTSTALVDVVGVNTAWTGARALWEPETFVEAVIANSRSTSVGIASVAAALGRLEPGHIRHVRFGAGDDVRVLLGPGLVKSVSIAGYTDLPRGARVVLDPACRVVALDGERRAVTAARVEVSAVAGPRLLLVSTALDAGLMPGR